MRGLAYLNYAGLAPVRPAAALAGLLPTELVGNALLPQVLRWQDGLRADVGAWLGVTARNVALLGSTSQALQAVALGIVWQPGDVVLYPEDDFPSNVLPWEGLRRFGVRPQAVTDWQTPWPDRARLVAISTVDYATGVERPWREVCARARQAGIATCVDAVQSAGIKPAHSPDVDFWAAGVHKWLVSGTGLALLVVSDRALASAQAPWTSYLSFQTPMHPESGVRDDARRWELGWITPAATLRFRSNLRFFARLGWERVSAEVQQRRDLIHRELLTMGWPVVSSSAAWSGIVSFRPDPLDPHAVVERGYRRRIVLADRGPCVRLSAHRFTRQAEIERTLDWLWTVRKECA